MEIEIRNFLGIKEANIPLLDSVLAVIGHNASGKTSIAIAIAGILSRNSNPLGLGSSAKPYMHDSSDHGEVVLRGEESMELRRWILEERGIRVLADVEEDCDKHALGLTDFIALPTKYRAQAWEQAFLPPPKELVSMLGEELGQQIAQEAQVEEVLRELRVREWNDVATIYASKARESKRQWSEITGAGAWGSNKADQWFPKGWKSEWDAVTPAESRTRLEESRELVRMAQVSQAIGEADSERAAAAAAEIPSLEKELLVHKENLREATEKLVLANSHFGGIRDEGITLKSELQSHEESKPEREHSVPCPSCGESLVIGPGQRLSRAKDESAFEAHIQAWSMGREKLLAQLNGLRDQAKKVKIEEVLPAEQLVQDIRKKHFSAAGLLSVAQRDSKLGEGTVVTEEDQRRQSEAEQAVDDARIAAELIGRKVNSRNAHLSALNYASIAAALGSKGIRTRAMRGRMDELKENLQEISEVTSWPKVELDSTYAVLINGRYGVVTASSEKWRARFMLQCSIALVKKEKRVIADGADILDQTEAPRFFRLCEWLVSHKVYPIVCATGTITGLPPSWKVVHVANGEGGEA